MVSEKVLYGAVAVLTVFAVVFGFMFVAANNNADALQQNLANTDDALEQVEAQLITIANKYDSAQSEITTLQESLAEKDAALKAAAEQLEAIEQEQEETTETEEPVVTVQAEVIDDLNLGDAVSFVLDDGDLEKLFDGEITFNDEEYDAHEEFVAVNSKSYIMYSAIDDEELGANPAYGLTDSGALEYRYVFDEPIALTDISSDEPLSIVFLGRELEIVSASASEVEVRFGEKLTLFEGDSVVVDGKEVLLKVLGDDGAFVCVDGTCDFVEKGDTETINGVDVLVDEVVAKDQGLGVASLYVGGDTLITMESGDEWMDIDDSEFDFVIETSAGELTSLKVVYNEQRDNVDDEFAPLFVGDKLSFPFDYLTVEVTEVVEADYKSFTLEFDGFSEELENGTDVDNDECVVIKSEDKDGIEVSDDETDELFVCSNGNVYYEDSTGDWFSADVSDVTLVNDDTEVTLTANSTAIVFEFPDNNVTLDVDWAEERFGSEEDEAEATDIIWGTTNIGTFEYDFLTSYGIVIDVPEDSADRDEFSFSLPTDRLELELSVY